MNELESPVHLKFVTRLSSRQAWLVILLYLSLMIISAIWVNKYIDRAYLQSIVDRSGRLGIIAFLIIEYLYVIFVPIYNTAIHIASGYIFGGNIGWILNFTATTAGLFTIVYLVKNFGRTVLTHVVSNKTINKYDSIMDKIGPVSLFLVYVLPGFPDDEVTYMIAAGGNISFWRFVLPILLGNVTKAAVSYIGDEGVKGLPMALGSRLVVLIIGLVIISGQEYWVRQYYKRRNV